MNRIIYVPADSDARATDRTARLVITIGRGPSAHTQRIRAVSAAAADAVAARRGWVRLASLTPSERRLYRKGE